MSVFWVALIDVAITVVLVTGVAWVVDWPLARLGRRHSWMADLSRRCRRPFRVAAAAVAALAGVHVFAPPAGGPQPLTSR